MKTCLLFPGQGAQYPGMARDLWESSPRVKEMFQSASDALRMDMRKLLFDSTEEDLKATDKTQVAMTLASLCSSAVLKERGIVPDACAGFSLGEFAALCEAGVLKFADVFPIVRIRGELMEKAARGLDSNAGAPGMAAVLGLPAEKTVAVVQALSSAGVFPANYNSPVQVVISGSAQGLALAEKELKGAGAKRLVRLQVSGPFHSPLMAEARAAFDAALSSFTFADPAIAMYSNVTGKKIGSGKEARELCGKQLVSMVRWVEVEEGLLADGCDRFFESGPGTVLTGLLRAMRPEARCSPAGTLVSIGRALEEKE
ncbi:MAG: ACP S-malonyltransferase [Spirochaetia bacterium]|jgi:[acyl-carrier-protein] S-malonyltransferase